MPDPVETDQIEALARAIFGALSPITGERASGTVTASALAGPEPVAIPKNTYLRPVVRGELREDLVYKTTDDFTIAAGTIESGLPITSNLGGARHNLPAGTAFRFDPVPAGLGVNAVADAPGITGGSNTGQLLRGVAFFEDIDSGNPQADIFEAKLDVPGLLLVWRQSDPVDGASDGLQQGASRRARGVRTFRESFIAYIITARLTGDPARRREGLMIAQAVSRLLTDRLQNDDGEQLSTVGAGVTVTGRSRFRRSEKTYIYAVTFTTNATLEKAPDTRSFARWLRTRSQGAAVETPQPPPEDSLVIVDVTDPMP